MSEFYNVSYRLMGSKETIEKINNAINDGQDYAAVLEKLGCEEAEVCGYFFDNEKPEIIDGVLHAEARERYGVVNFTDSIRKKLGIEVYFWMLGPVGIDENVYTNDGYHGVWRFFGDIAEKYLANDEEGVFVFNPDLNDYECYV